MFRYIPISALLATLASAQNCVLQLPANLLTAQGLATPIVQSNCSQRAGTASFVECAINDRKGGLTYYHPLIVDQGDVVGKNFVAPVPATVPAGAMVACYFGTNGASTTLAGPGAKLCVNGLPGSIFGQFAACNGAGFMQAALADVQAGTLKVPALGTASTGGGCPTVRDFRIVDQDQSDNCLTEYALLNNGAVVAQATPANSKNATMILNGSDNRLVDAFIDPALGCTPWMVPSVTAPTGMSSGIATNELQAASFQAAPIALVPPNDPMVLDGNGNQNLQKTNLYRTAVGQPPLQSLNANQGLQYCNNITIGGIFAAQNMALLANNPSPMPDVANNLYTFLAQRFAAAINNDNLGCLGLWNITTNPVMLTMDGNGVVTAATINVQVLQTLGMGKTPTSSSSVAQSSTTSKATSTKTSAAASSTFTGFKNTTRSTASATAVASASASIVSASSNGNKGATLTAPTTLATMTVAATGSQTKAASSTAVGGGTGAMSSAAAVLPSATCTCPSVAAPTASAAAQFVLLANGIVKNTQSGQIYVPVPAFLDNLFEPHKRRG